MEGKIINRVIFCCDNLLLKIGKSSYELQKLKELIDALKKEYECLYLFKRNNYELENKIKDLGLTNDLKIANFQKISEFNKDNGCKDIVICDTLSDAIKYKKRETECILVSVEMILNNVDIVFNNLHSRITNCLANKDLKKVFINDLVVKEKLCNMRCKYCLTDTSQFKKDDLYTREPDIVYRDGSKLKFRLDKVSDIICSSFDMGILKISGGEIFLINNILEYIENESKKYKAVQILTNGVLLDIDILKRLKGIENICIQISLDHNEIEGNQYRTGDLSTQSIILKNIDNIVNLGIPLEINCVLTDKNTGILTRYLDYLMRYENKLMIVPFPIRGTNRDEFLPSAKQIEEISKIINEYDRYSGILPTKTYFEHLVDFFDCGKRKLICYLPKIALGSFDNGELTPCSNYWFNSLGNVLNEEFVSVLDKIENDKIYKVLLGKRHMPFQCEKCFTPWELVNLYFNDIISVDELCKAPLYKLPGIREYFTKIKKEL